MRRQSVRRAAFALALIAFVLAAWAAWLEPASLSTDDVALNVKWRSSRTLRLWTGRHDLDAALARVPADGNPVLLLTHNPDIFPMVPARVTLTLAGHTHGGQVRLPFFGPPIVPSRFGQRFASGHVVEGGRHLYVATGVGTSILPVRFLVPPAVTILNLGNDVRSQR